MREGAAPLRAAWSLCVACGRAIVLLPLYFLTLTLFALWPWRLGPPFFLVRPLGLLRQAPRASALRLIMLRLELRTEWTSRAPGRIRVPALRAWLVRPWRETWPACLRLARQERRESGLSRTERRALFLSALPDGYRYANGIATRFWFDPDRRSTASNHIPNLPYHVRIGCCLLNHACNPSLPRLQRHFDKVVFHEMCRSHGWPTVPVFASFTAGAVRRHEPVSDGRLLSKPAGLAEGRGRFQRWSPVDGSRNGERRYRDDEGRVLRLEALFDHLARLSVDTPYLLQGLVGNHEEIRALSGVDTLCTLRVPTCRHVDGRVEVLPLAFFRMPARPDALFDNMAQGGIAYGVDLESGRLQAGATYEAREVYRVHPTTGRTVVGFTLPFFAEALQQVRLAHAEGMSAFPTVGWDVALTPRGPLLLEGNVQWSSEHLFPGEGFLGGTAYATCLLGHLRRLWPEAVGEA